MQARNFPSQNFQYNEGKVILSPLNWRTTEKKNNAGNCLLQARWALLCYIEMKENEGQVGHIEFEDELKGHYGWI